VNEQLLEKKIIGGLELGKWYPELKHAALWCVTEQNTRTQMDAAAPVVASAKSANSEKVLAGA